MAPGFTKPKLHSAYDSIRNLGGCVGFNFESAPGFFSQIEPCLNELLKQSEFDEVVKSYRRYLAYPSLQRFPELEHKLKANSSSAEPLPLYQILAKYGNEQGATQPARGVVTNALMAVKDSIESSLLEIGAAESPDDLLDYVIFSDEVDMLMGQEIANGEVAALFKDANGELDVPRLELISEKNRSAFYQKHLRVKDRLKAQRHLNTRRWDRVYEGYLGVFWTVLTLGVLSRVMPVSKVGSAIRSFVRTGRHAAAGYFALYPAVFASDL